MALLKKFDLSGREVGSVEMVDSSLDLTVNGQLIKDYIVALRRNARQWSANTKGRSEVWRTGKKPHPQKGQGRSRQGCVAAPQYKGGGIVFGPKPKFDQHVRINRKERKAAIRFLIAEKVRENRVSVLQSSDFDAPKTSRMANFFKTVQIDGRRVLILGEPETTQPEMLLSMRNLPRKDLGWISQVNGYDLACCQELVILDTALDQFLNLMSPV